MIHPGLGSWLGLHCVMGCNRSQLPIFGLSAALGNSNAPRVLKKKGIQVFVDLTQAEFEPGGLPNWGKVLQNSSSNLTTTKHLGNKANIFTRNSLSN